MTLMRNFKMKKLYHVVLSCFCVLLLCSCGGNDTDLSTCLNCKELISTNSNFCFNCGYEQNKQSVEESDFTEEKEHQHNYSIATCTVPATCIVCGEIDGDALGHDYSEATCNQPSTCIKCNEEVGEPLGHSYEQGLCIRCKVTDPNYSVLIYEDSKVKIFYKKVTSKGVVFDVENLTNATITIQADTIALNHISTDNITMSDEVAPYSIGEVCARCNIPGIDNVGMISGQLRIIDFNKSFKSYDASFVNVVINSNVNISNPNITDTLLYSDSRVNIYYTAIDGSGVTFTVENLTDVVVSIQADAISVNKRSTDNITMSDDVAPQSTGTIKARCSFGTVPETVETVGGTLRIIDFNKSFDSYKATFINVPIN